jgi:hypothetical protein
MRRLLVVFAGLGMAGWAEEARVTIQPGTPLRVALAAKTRLGAVGEPVRGSLFEAVYVGDREALPAGAVVEGKIASVKAASRGRR